MTLIITSYNIPYGEYLIFPRLKSFFYFDPGIVHEEGCRTGLFNIGHQWLKYLPMRPYFLGFANVNPYQVEIIPKQD